MDLLFTLSAFSFIYFLNSDIFQHRRRKLISPLTTQVHVSEFRHFLISIMRRSPAIPTAPQSRKAFIVHYIIHSTVYTRSSPTLLQIRIIFYYYFKANTQNVKPL